MYKGLKIDVQPVVTRPDPVASIVLRRLTWLSPQAMDSPAMPSDLHDAALALLGRTDRLPADRALPGAAPIAHPSPPRPSLFIAHLFWLCSGFMGIHRFYLRSALVSSSSGSSW